MMDKSKNNKILAGWASRDISPSRPTGVFGQSYQRISENVNDPITVTALALESDSGEQAVLVSCDLMHASEKMIAVARERIADKAPGLNVRNVVVSGTHVHTGPYWERDSTCPEPDSELVGPEEYLEFLAERIAECVGEAWEKRRDSNFGWGLGQAVVARNRRVVYFDGHSQMYGKTADPEFSHLEGFEDHNIDILFIWTPAGKLTGAVVNVACPAQISEHEKYISADFWHEVRQEIRKRHGSHLFVLPQCGPGGDQSPHPLISTRAERRMRELMGVSKRQEIAERIAHAFDRTLAAVSKDIRTESAFEHVVKDIGLPVQMITEEQMLLAREDLAVLDKAGPPSDGDTAWRIGRNRNVIKRYEEQKSGQTWPMELHVLRIGDIAMATNPFELFVDYGLRIKARSPAIQTFLVQLCGGSAYLPTQRAYDGGGYGAYASALIGPDGGQALVEETLKEIDRMWK